MGLAQREQAFKRVATAMNALDEDYAELHDAVVELFHKDGRDASDHMVRSFIEFLYRSKYHGAETRYAH